MSVILVSVLGLSITAYAQTTSIPKWVKNTALWWGQGQIGDDDYIKSIQWLVDNGYIKLASQTSSSQSNNAQTSTQQLTSDEAKTNQGILDEMDSCTKVTNDISLKICIDYAKNVKQICDNLSTRLPACDDSRLTKLAEQPVMSPFSNTVCKQNEYGGVVEMTGQFTNDGTARSFISLKLGVFDSNGNVVATGAGIISNIKAYETKIFDASALYSGSFSNCKIQVDTQLP